MRALDRSLGLTRAVAACFVDRRHPDFVEHELAELVAQRIYALALGYEDLNDHNRLRHDPLLACSAGKAEPGEKLASASTLNRLEIGASKAGSRYHKIDADAPALQALLIRTGVRTLQRRSREVIIDLDATHDPLHGKQEGRVFHGYYDCYCYLPLYAFIGEALVWAQLRTADRDAADGHARVFHEFSYRTLDSWSRPRRVVGKAERLPGKDNPRFVVTSLTRKADELYEKVYCARGEMENRIKEQQGDLFGERLSSHTLAANQLRLWLTAFAYVLMERMRNRVRAGTELAQATANPIRLRLFKLAARVEISTRRIRVRLAHAAPVQALFALAWRRLHPAPA